MEFDWFWGALEGLIAGDQYGTGPIPMPQPQTVISEVPRTLEDLQREQRDLEREISQSPVGTGTLPPIDEEKWGDIIRIPVPESPAEMDDDEVAVTWSDWFADTAQGIIGDYLEPTSQGQLQGFVPTGPVGPSTPANQAATAAAMQNCEGMAWTGGTPPKGYKVVNHCGVGVLRKVRRRRRRRMLTASDASDLATIVGIVGKGQMAAQMINRR